MNQSRAGFTLIELLTVMAIIIILAGLVLGTSGYVQKKGARARTEAEIAALSAALESYKADNGLYPRDSTTGKFTDTLDARATVNPLDSNYTKASLYLYGELSGDRDFNRQPDANSKSYMEFKPSMLNPSDGKTTPITAIVDPFGNSYGYSTANQADNTKGYNPTFDLWSTGGQTTATGTGQWLKNW
jgi:prepilin-type N-terminal cleavage/methylation domain-containing protein